MINIFCDGGCIVGKNIGAESFVVVNNGKILWLTSSLIDGWHPLTNNMSEYQAIIGALHEYNTTPNITIHSDSELVVNQINGEYTVKDSTLKLMHKEVMLLCEDTTNIKFIHVPRENKYIQIADKMNKIIMNEAKK